MRDDTDCGCCEGLEAETPRGVWNRPALSAISTRVGLYGDFRESLLARLSSTEFPALGQLTTRDDDDFTIALCDAFSCMADVLSFYQERIANENYLRTATERRSVLELASLIGYKLAPGVAAATWLAFALDRPPAKVAGASRDPGDAVSGVPDVVTLEPGVRVQSVAGQDERPQTFETLETIAARPEWNAMTILPDEDRPPGFGATSTWLAGTSTQLQPGDAILFVGDELVRDPKSNRWDVRYVTAVKTDAALNRTRITWGKPLGSVSPAMFPASEPLVFALRKRASIFGHNAPDWNALTDEFKASYLGVGDKAQLTDEHRKGGWPGYDIFAPTGSGREIRAFVSPVQAAEVLRDMARAEAVSLGREGLMSVTSVLGSAGNVVEKVGKLPGTVATSALEVAKAIPDAVGQIALTIMEPIEQMVGIAGTAMSSSLNVITGRVDSVAQAMNRLVAPINWLLEVAPGPNPGMNVGSATTGGLPTAPTITPPSIVPPAGWTTGIADLASAVGSPTTGALGAITTGVADIADAANDFRHSNATVIEAAVANVAAVAYLARIEMSLLVEPHMPGATTDGVTTAAEMAGDEAATALPYFITAAVLSDPRVALLLFAVLVDDVDAPSPEVVKRTMNDLGSSMRSLVQSSDPVSAGTSAADLLRPILQGGSATFSLAASPVRRIFDAAQRGINRLHGPLTRTAGLLREGSLARTLPGRANRSISLDRSYPSVLEGGWAVLVKPDYSELFAIEGARDASRAEFALSGKSTLLRLSGDRLSIYANAVQETSVLLESEQLARARTPVTEPVAGSVLDLAGVVDGLLPGRRIIAQGIAADGGHLVAHAATIEEVTLGSDRSTIRITPALPTALVRESVVVFGNVVPASHGETVRDELAGNGDASARDQRFTLRQAPLTYVASADPRGASSTLTVRANDLRWNEVPSLHDRGAHDRVYELVQDDSGVTSVLFGDGEEGARLPTGQTNIRLHYRKGLGAEGNVRAGKLTTLLSRPLGVRGVTNPLPATGGQDAEQLSGARDNAPLRILTLDRAVSVQDYSDFARAFAGIAKSAALWITDGRSRGVHITVAGQDGGDIPEGGSTQQKLINALRNSGDARLPISVRNYRRIRFGLSASVKFHPDADAAKSIDAVRGALVAAFSFNARSLGEQVSADGIYAVIHTVEHVVAADIAELYAMDWGIHWPQSGTRLLAAMSTVQSDGSVSAAELLTLDRDALQLSIMP